MYCSNESISETLPNHENVSDCATKHKNYRLYHNQKNTKTR